MSTLVCILSCIRPRLAVRRVHGDRDGSACRSAPTSTRMERHAGSRLGRTRTPTAALSTRQSWPNGQRYLRRLSKQQLRSKLQARSECAEIMCQHQHGCHSLACRPPAGAVARARLRTTSCFVSVGCMSAKASSLVRALRLPPSHRSGAARALSPPCHPPLRRAQLQRRQQGRRQLLLQPRPARRICLRV